MNKQTNQTNHKLTATLAIALTLSIASWGSTQRASAQTIGDAINLISLPFNSILNPQPEQPVNRSVGAFSGNLNGNKFNVCILPTCQIPAASLPSSVPPSTISSNTTTGVTSFPVAPNNIPSNVSPVRPTPPRPVLVVPPIKLPINLPL